uniref:Tetratricopeptide repeat protein n=1 Tax=viral metagenome TaxID=1070528 RepID=A0A6C0CJC6_9ZZZZ
MNAKLWISVILGILFIVFVVLLVIRYALVSNNYIADGNKCVKQGKYQEAIEYYKLYLADCKNDRQRAKVCILIARAYHDGLEDGKSAVVYYMKSYELGNVDCLKDVGDIFNWGLRDKSIINKDRAMLCYTTIMRRSTNKELVQVCRELVNRQKPHTRIQPRGLFNQTSRAAPSVDRVPFVERHPGFRPGIEDTHFRQPAPTREQVMHTQPRGAELDINDIGLYVIDENAPQPATHIRPPRITVALINQRRANFINPAVFDANADDGGDATEGRVRNDKQNVHDTVVSNTVRASVQKLRESEGHFRGYNNDTALKEIHEYIRNAPVSESAKASATKTLMKCSRTNQHISSLGIGEHDVMRMVWNRIHHPSNKDNVENLKESLVLSLASGEERGEVVCATGRVDRIIDSLNKIDNENIVDIKPKWAINREIMEKCPVLREKFLNNHPQDIRVAMEAVTPTMEQQKVCDEYTAKLKTYIREELYKDYVDTGILSKTGLNIEVDKWIEYL